MFFKNIPETVEDFKEKEKTWYGFEKALEVLGLNSKVVLERLKSGQKAYENVEDQNIKCQKAYIEYVKEPNVEANEGPAQRTVRLKERKKVTLKGRPTKHKEETTESTKATSSNPCKELEELVQAKQTQEYRTQKGKEQ